MTSQTLRQYKTDGGVEHCWVFHFSIQSFIFVGFSIFVNNLFQQTAQNYTQIKI